MMASTPCRSTNLVKTKSGKSWTIESSCPFAYSLKLGAAAIGKSTVCANIPIKCPICEDLVWRYNIPAHVGAEHAELELESVLANPLMVGPKPVMCADVVVNIKVLDTETAKVLRTN
jgi:hypothetical protein